MPSCMSKCKSQDFNFYIKNNIWAPVWPGTDIDVTLKMSKCRFQFLHQKWYLATWRALEADRGGWRVQIYNSNFNMPSCMYVYLNVGCKGHYFNSHFKVAGQVEILRSHSKYLNVGLFQLAMLRLIQDIKITL